MKPHTDTNTLPLSIAQVNSSPESASTSAKRSGSDVLALHDRLLAAVVTRVGEVEAAEWALDQARAACQAQVTAALSAGVPADEVAEAAGICSSALAEIVGGREPALAQG